MSDFKKNYIRQIWEGDACSLSPQLDNRFDLNKKFKQIFKSIQIVRFQNDASIEWNENETTRIRGLIEI